MQDADPSAEPVPAAETRGTPPASSELRVGADLLVTGLLALLAAAMLPLGTPHWWFGAAFGAAAIAFGRAPVMALLGRVGARWPLLSGYRGPVAGLLCVATLAALAALMLAPAIGGDRPVDHDHPVHYLRTWEIHEHFLAEGRLLGWSHRWFAGQPVNYLYPFGADLWVIGVWALSFGALTISEAYGVALWLFYVLLGYSAYRFGSRAFGRGVGLVAGCLTLVDAGAFRYGGWVFSLEWGVWPQSLSVAFAVLAVAELPAILDGAGWRPVARFGALMGMAILTHPLQVVFVVIAAAVAMVARAMARPPVPWLTGPARLGAAGGLALMVAAGWLLPFLTSKPFTASFGVPWVSAWEMGAALVEGDALQGTHWFVLAGAVLGVTACLRSRQFIHLYTGLMVVVLLGVSVSSFVDELHLTAVSDAFSRIQYERFAILLKPFALVAAAAAIVHGARALVGEPAAGRVARVQGAAKVFVVALLLAPLAVGAGTELYRTAIDRDLNYASERKDAKGREAFLAWARTLPKDGFFRWGVVAADPDHELMDLGVELDAPIYKSSFVPAATYRYKVWGTTPQTLRALNVRYLVTRQNLAGADYELLKQFGSLRVYRFRPWQPLPFEVTGSGPVALQRFEDERIELLAGPGATGKLSLNVSHYDRWHATRDGEPVEITAEPREHVPAGGFMTVPLAPGAYVFEFRPSFADRAGMALSLLGLLVAFALLLVDVERPFARRARGLLEAGLAPLRRWELRWPAVPVALLTVLLALGTATGVGLAAWTPPLQRKDDGPVYYDFRERLDRATVTLVDKGEPRPCRRQIDRFTCADTHNWDVGPELLAIEGYSTRRCIAVRPPRRGKLVLRFEDVPLQGRIVGHLGMSREAKGYRAVTFNIAVDGHNVLRKDVKDAGRTHSFATPLPKGAQGTGEVSFSLETKGSSDEPFCVYVQMAE